MIVPLGFTLVLFSLRSTMGGKRDVSDRPFIGESLNGYIFAADNEVNSVVNSFDGRTGLLPVRGGVEQ